MIAIIPAREGSKGLPGKNLRNFAGIPLICYTIKAAIEAKTISRVIVSTDDQNIAAVARECGAEVPFIRPKNLAKDDSMVMDSYFYTIDRLSKEMQSPINSFVALLPTVPLRLAKDIDCAVKIFNKKQSDSVISVTKAPVPVYWHRKINKEGILSDYMPKFNAVVNRQELEETYVPNGAIYVFKTEKLRTTRQYYTDNTYPYIMPRERSADIDDLLDFEWAEFLIKRSKSKR
jgi:CMP-N,N'-diacetyllegionaminic acid synthase